MALNAISKVAPEWYLPESQKEEDEPARIKVRPLTSPQLEEVFEQTENGIDVPMRNYRLVLKYGIVDWENVNDPDTGKALKCTPMNHGRLPVEERIELVGVIIERSQMTEDDRKNS